MDANTLRKVKEIRKALKGLKARKRRLLRAQEEGFMIYELNYNINFNERLLEKLKTA